MSPEAIEQKLSELERRLEAVELEASRRKNRGAWQELVGWAKNDDLFLHAALLGAAWRQRINVEPQS